MAPGHQVLHRLEPAGPVVHGDRDAALQRGVIAVEEHHGNSHLPQLLIQGQVGVGQGAFGALHNQPVHLLVNVLLQHAALVVHLVFRGGKQGEKPLFRKLRLNAPKDGGEDVLADIGGHHPHVPRALAPGLAAAHIGTAALPALDKILLLQQGKGLADSLAAHAILLGHLVLPGKALAPLVRSPQDLPLQPFKQLDVFRSVPHHAGPLPPDLAGQICTYILPDFPRRGQGSVREIAEKSAFLQEERSTWAGACRPQPPDTAASTAWW